MHNVFRLCEKETVKADRNVSEGKRQDEFPAV